MDFFVWQRTVVNEEGRILPSASVSVTDVVSGALTQLYSDEGVTGIGNPITADANGFVQFYVKAGFYDIVASLAADSRTWNDEAIGSPYKITAAEISAGVTPTNYAYPELDVRRYGDTFDAAHLQAAIDFWVAKGSGTLVGAGQTFNTGGTEVVVTFNASIEPMTFDGQGMRIKPSATIDSGNGAGLKITRVAGSLVRNKTFRGFQVYRDRDVAPTADFRGIEVDGKLGAGVNGFLYNLLFDDVHVYDVTRDAWRIGGYFFESWFNFCSARIDTNESGYHCFALNATGNDDTSGQLSSIELKSCNLSGGQNNVNLATFNDVVKCIGGTYILSAKEAVKTSDSGHREFVVDKVHIENPWSGASAVKSASWISTTNQAAVRLVGSGAVTDCYMVSSTDACRQMVYAYATGTVQVRGNESLRNGSVGDFAYIVRLDGTATGHISADSNKTDSTNAVALFDTNAATNVRYSGRGNPQFSDQVGIKPFVAADATPSVLGLSRVRTIDTTTITDLDDGLPSQEVVIYVDHAMTFDCTGTDLKAAGGADITAAAGDMVVARTKDGTTWRLEHVDCT